MDAALALLSLDPDRCYVGALLHLGAAAVVDVSRLVDADDLADAQVRAVYRLAVELAESGRAPDPPLVMAEAVTLGQVVGHRQAVLALLLAGLHAGVPTPASVRHYAAAVLDAAVRRRVVQMGTRIMQAAGESSTAGILATVADEYRAVVAVAERRDAARQDVTL